MRGSVFILASTLISGCNDPTYIPEGRQLKIGDDADGGAGALAANDTELFQIPIRAPTSVENTQRVEMAKTLNLPRGIPWLGVPDLPVEIQYTLTNLDATPAQAFLSVVGASEFGLYDPGAFYNPNDPNQRPPPPLLGGSPIDLAPMETKNLVFREDDVAEAARDLEAIVRFPDPANPASTPYEVLTRRSDVDPKGTEAIPSNDVIPQIISYTFVLTADAHVTCDYSVRVRNLGNKLAPPGKGNYP